MKEKLSIGVIVDKSNATGHERVLPPIPYLKTNKGLLGKAPKKPKYKCFGICKFCPFRKFIK